VTEELAVLGVSDDALERARLLVSELAGNVVRHTTSGQFAVRLSVEQGLEVGVHDEDRVAVPESRREPRLLDLGGRGLVVIASLADAWGIEHTSAGKWVRVLIADDDPEERADSRH
jgi:anti-sigma regulatory factor (Ser/Thr protein kinase)